MRLFIYLFLFIPFIASAQIQLKNSSFENEPQDATMPSEWKACEFGTTPDILPGFWGVYNEPYDGETYLGLITRKDGTFESIGQELSTPLDRKECYSIGMYLAHSKAYSGYDIPVRLRIWGGTKRCDKKQLIADTEVIENVDWEYYQFDFVSKKKISFITIEAYYAPGVYFPYQGNVLLDGITAFKTCQRAYLD